LASDVLPRKRVRERAGGERQKDARQKKEEAGRRGGKIRKERGGEGESEKGGNNGE
jgi:hypothetical protein